jgi:hypothetical protein
MNYRQLKALARRADRARGEERKRLVEKLIRELPKLNPWEGVNSRTRQLAEYLAWIKWIEVK